MSSVRIVAMAIAAVAAVSAAGSASAHHSTAMFDMNKNVVLTGTIKEFQWTNPHTFIYIQVPNAAGSMEEYSIEGMSPKYLARPG